MRFIRQMVHLSLVAALFSIVFLCVGSVRVAGFSIDLGRGAGVPAKPKPDFANTTTVNVGNIEELYIAVNDSANSGSLIVLAPGIYVLSEADPGGTARPNGGRLELQENMSLRGVAGNRAAVVIDAVSLPAGSYAGGVPNTGAVRLGRGSNSIEWLTIKNAVSGGAGIITHLDSPGTAYVRIAHCISSGNSRGIDIRNVASFTEGFVIEAEIVDNDLYDNRIATAQGLRIINTQGVSGNTISAYLSGNRIFDNEQGLLVENIGGTSLGVVSVYSSGDRFFGNGGGASIGAAFGPSNNSTVNFTAVGAVFENNNGSTDFYRGGLIVAGSVSFQTPNGGSNNTANIILRHCRFANNQVADLRVYGASSLPASIGPSGENNQATVRLFGTPIANVVIAASDPVNPTGMNSAKIIRNSVFPSPDIDGDGRADLSVYRPSDLVWYINGSQTGFRATQFGLADDKLVPADYDGDGKTDISVFRDGVWWRINSSDSVVLAVPFGQAGDIPVPADYTGDGRSELAVYRGGAWWALDLETSHVSVIQLGLPSDRPLTADYDADGRADQVVYRDGEWHINRSSDGYIVFQFGIPSDRPLAGDFDADGTSDLAVYRDGTWHINHSAHGPSAFEFGLASDIPVPADYDGDGKTDAAVFRDGVWWINGSTGGISTHQFGLSGDKPIASAYSP